MSKTYDQRTAARLIANTRRKKRPDNLVEIAGYIRRLEKDVGSLKAVSEIPGIDVSTDMLRQFLSVEKLCPEVKEMVRERKIDLVNIVHYMHGFEPRAQRIMCREITEGLLSANDIRVLASLHRSLPEFTIEQIISRVQESRGIKVYVAHFWIPPELENVNLLEKRFEDLVGTSEIISFTAKDSVGTLELTSKGKKRIREAAREHKLSLRKFVDRIVRM